MPEVASKWFLTFFMSSSPVDVGDAVDSALSEDASSAALSHVGTIINIPPVCDNLDSAENFVDNYELDGENGVDYTLC